MAQDSAYTADYLSIPVSKPGLCLAILKRRILLFIPVIYIISIECRYKIFMVTIKAVRKVYEDSPLRLSLYLFDR